MIAVRVAHPVDRDGLRDLAVRAIELHLRAGLGYVEDDVFTAPRTRSNRTFIGHLDDTSFKPMMGPNQHSDEQQNEGYTRTLTWQSQHNANLNFLPLVDAAS